MKNYFALVRFHTLIWRALTAVPSEGCVTKAQQSAFRHSLRLSRQRTTAPDLWCHDDEEEDAELNTLCHARQGEMPIEVDIDNI
ncbi:hypothetical protein A3747_14115 [Sulfitobacter sp. HI0076]|nr:hypothetical protein A3720_00055 [Sulfitobacter sp. HI0021]KZY01978.1 hypothetical protein A3722_06525 [Sulfitobacter sp. HI0027]KZZ02846.1 hypothetical protein A3747_14115 [Sulfitobacter sp. HI0076]